MQSAQNYPDTSPLREIVAKNQLKHLKITDFKIIAGYRLYKIEWKQILDNQPRFKWQRLQALEPYIESVLNYEACNAQPIKTKESEWEQYFFDGQVKQPLEYFNKKKFVEDEDQNIAQDSDSQFEIRDKKAKRKIVKKGDNGTKSFGKKGTKSKRSANSIKRGKNLTQRISKLAGNLKIKKADQELQVDNEQLALEKEFEKCFQNWSIEIPYLQLSESPQQGMSIQIPESKKQQQTIKQQDNKEEENYIIDKKIIKKLEQIRQNSQNEHNEGQNHLISEEKDGDSEERDRNSEEKDKDSEERDGQSYNLFSSTSNDAFSLQSLEEVISEQPLYKRPENIRDFIKQQMIALNIESPAQLLASEAEVKHQQSQFFSIKQPHMQYEKIESTKIKNSCKFVDENQANIKKQQKRCSLAQIFAQLQTIPRPQRTEMRKNSAYRYIYENLLSADDFRGRLLPPITQINNIVTFGPLTLYSVFLDTATKPIQKFVLPEVIALYYGQIQQILYSDN